MRLSLETYSYSNCAFVMKYGLFRKSSFITRVAANLSHYSKSDEWANCAAFNWSSHTETLLKIPDLEVQQRGMPGGILEADPQEACDVVCWENNWWQGHLTKCCQCLFKLPLSSKQAARIHHRDFCCTFPSDSWETENTSSEAVPDKMWNKLECAVRVKPCALRAFDRIFVWRCCWWNI